MSFNINKWFKTLFLSPFLYFLDLLIGGHVCALDVIELKKNYNLKNRDVFQSDTCALRLISQFRTLSYLTQPFSFFWQVVLHNYESERCYLKWNCSNDFFCSILSSDCMGWAEHNYWHRRRSAFSKFRSWFWRIQSILFVQRSRWSLEPW